MIYGKKIYMPFNIYSVINVITCFFSFLFIITFITKKYWNNRLQQANVFEENTSIFICYYVMLTQQMADSKPLLVKTHTHAHRHTYTYTNAHTHSEHSDSSAAVVYYSFIWDNRAECDRLTVYTDKPSIKTKPRNTQSLQGQLVCIS